MKILTNQWNLTDTDAILHIVVYVVWKTVWRKCLAEGLIHLMPIAMSTIYTNAQWHMHSHIPTRMHIQIYLYMQTVLERAYTETSSSSSSTANNHRNKFKESNKLRHNTIFVCAGAHDDRQRKHEKSPRNETKFSEPIASLIISR